MAPQRQRESYPYLTASRRRVVPYAQVSCLVASWEGRPYNGHWNDLSTRDRQEVLDAWVNEHDHRRGRPAQQLTPGWDT